MKEVILIYLETSFIEQSLGTRVIQSYRTLQEPLVTSLQNESEEEFKCFTTKMDPYNRESSKKTNPSQCCVHYFPKHALALASSSLQLCPRAWSRCYSISDVVIGIIV